MAMTGAIPVRRRTRVRSRRVAVLGIALGALPIVLLYVLGFVSFPFSPIQPDSSAVLLAPNATHLFGTDASGFDVFARTFRSAQLDIPLAFGGTLLAALIGVPIGLITSSEGVGSTVIMRIVDALQALPLLIVAIAIVTLSGRNIGTVVFAIVLVTAPNFIRLVRGGALVVRGMRYVEAAASLGASKVRIYFVHVLPNVAGLVLAQLTLSVGMAIIIIAALNFLGVGVPPPTPTWGGMIKDGSGVIVQGAWWVALFPSLAVVALIASLAFVARQVEDLLRTR